MRSVVCAEREGSLIRLIAVFWALSRVGVARGGARRALRVEFGLGTVSGDLSASTREREAVVVMLAEEEAAICACIFGSSGVWLEKQSKGAPLDVIGDLRRDSTRRSPSTLLLHHHSPIPDGIHGNSSVMVSRRFSV